MKGLSLSLRGSLLPVLGEMFVNWKANAMLKNIITLMHLRATVIHVDISHKKKTDKGVEEIQRMTWNGEC